MACFLKTMAAPIDLLQFAIDNEDYELIDILIQEEPIPRGVTYNIFDTSEGLCTGIV
jgi:hypothetical protein